MCKWWSRHHCWMRSCKLVPPRTSKVLSLMVSNMPLNQLPLLSFWWEWRKLKIFKQSCLNINLQITQLRLFKTAPCQMKSIMSPIWGILHKMSSSTICEALLWSSSGMRLLTMCVNLCRPHQFLNLCNVESALPYFFKNNSTAYPHCWRWLCCTWKVEFYFQIFTR